MFILLGLKCWDSPVENYQDKNDLIFFTCNNQSFHFWNPYKLVFAQMICLWHLSFHGKTLVCQSALIHGLYWRPSFVNAAGDPCALINVCVTYTEHLNTSKSIKIMTVYMHDRSSVTKFISDFSIWILYVSKNAMYEASAVLAFCMITFIYFNSLHLSCEFISDIKRTMKCIT